MTLTRTRTVLIGAAITAAAILGFAAPASAHDSLVSSDPATGSSVEVAPDSVTLTFSADLMPDGAEAHVYEGTDPVAAGNAGGADFAGGPAVVDGTTLTIPLHAEIPAGTYSVNWRVVSSDGHAISTSDADIITFTVTKGAVATTEPTPEVTTQATTEPTAAPTTQPTADATQAPAQTDEGINPAVFVIVGGIVVVIAITVIIVSVLRKRRA